MQQAQTLKGVKLNMDIAPDVLPPDSTPFSLNQEVSINPNGGANGGASLGKQTPGQINFIACEVEQPSGENYTILKYSSQRTGEAFNGVYNTNGVNYIQRMRADGTCDIVYVGDCLSFNPAPKHSVEQFRCGMRVEKICNNWSGKELVWCDGDMVSPGCLDYEASVATNFFTTLFFDICPDPCAYIQLCVPEICGCVLAEFIPLPQSEVSFSNYITEKGFKFMVKHVYYDGRASEWSDWSSLYYQNIDCIGSIVGASRCMKLRVPIGNPMVEKIVIAFSEDGGATWYEYETVEKYKAYNNTQQQWFERELSEQVQSTFSDVDCCFDYIFCNDKNRKSIDAKEASRVRNPIPRKAQTLIQFAEVFAFFNYEDGICPLAKTEIEKINIAVDCTQPQCVDDIVSVTVRAIIYRPATIKDPSNNPSDTIDVGLCDTGFIYRIGGDSAQELDNVTDTAYYDYLSCEKVNAGFQAPKIGQQFYDNTRNFIVYIDGTNYWAEMKQWKAEPLFTNRKLVGVIPKFQDEVVRFFVRDSLLNGSFYYQEAIINVPKGTTGILRMVSHEASDGSLARQDTSEALVGTLNDINMFRTKHGFHGTDFIRNDVNFNKHEITFDTCNGSIDLKETFLIKDNRYGYVENFPIFSGYIKDNLGFPIEGVTFKNWGVQHDAGGNPLPSLQFIELVTDHNGYYNFFKFRPFDHINEIDVDFNGELQCNQWGIIKTEHFIGTDDFNSKLDITIDDSIVPFSTTRYATINVKTFDCAANPIQNIVLSITGSKSAITNSLGVASFRLRNYKDKPRVAKVVFTYAGNCVTVGCFNNCNPCYSVLEFILPTCFNPVPVLPTDPNDQIKRFYINRDAIENNNGLKPGGLYNFGIVAKGNCGRISAVYPVAEIAMPRVQDMGRYQFCNFNYNAQGVQFPEWVECVELVRTANLNSYELQWIVDTVDRTQGGDIKLTIQSLNDYNANFFFKTNTVYQYLKGDRVEFISNNGQILDSATYGILNYLVLSPFYDSLFHGNLEEPADYFNQLLIKDDGRLSMIKPGAIIEIQRPKQTTLELNPYFTICNTLNTVKVPNGDGTFHTELLNPIGEFTTFDTYFVRRNIDGAFYSFQHHSPSDFWGAKLTDVGRAHFVNKYENEKRYGRNVTINSATQLNYFGDFIKTFDGILGGDIIAAFIEDDRDLMVVGEHDAFLAKIANGLLQVDRNGNIQAASVDSIASDPADEPFGIYGCQYDDVGTPIEGDGFVCWWDSNKMAYVKHDYQLARDVSVNKVQSYIAQRTIQKNALNANTTDELNKLRFITGQNNKTKDIYITIKRLRDPGINNEKGPYLKLNETIKFNPLIDEWLGFASFTPEAYSNLNLQSSNGCSILSYLHGITYIHPVLAIKWLEWYGVSCDWMVTVVANQPQGKEMVFIAMQQQTTELPFFADKVETDKANYLSEIPRIKFKKLGQHWGAGFLGNKNSRGGLFGTELPKGCYVKVLFIRDNTLNLAYGTIDPAKRNLYSELGDILIKSAVSEESGFTSNV